MTKLVSLITGNPLVLLWIVLGSVAFGAASGGSAAWWIQGVRIDAAHNELTAYQQEQTRLAQEAKDAADAKRGKDGAIYAAMAKELSDEIAKGEVFRRCVAAGKCGRVRDVPAGTGLRLPPVAGVDEDRGSAVPAAGEPAAEVIPLVADCAKVQLRLNVLQAEIESQPGYPQ